MNKWIRYSSTKNCSLRGSIKFTSISLIFSPISGEALRYMIFLVSRRKHLTVIWSLFLLLEVAYDCLLADSRRFRLRLVIIEILLILRENIWICSSVSLWWSYFLLRLWTFYIFIYIYFYFTLIENHKKRLP